MIILKRKKILFLSNKNKKNITESKVVKVISYLKNEKLNEISGILFFAIGILFFLSIISFNINDPPNSTTNNVKNYCGLIGAYIAHYLFLIMGKGVFIFPILIIITGIYEFKDKKLKEATVLKIVGIIFITLSLSIFFNNIGGINLNSDLQFNDVRLKGGLIGLLLTQLFFPILKYAIFLLVFILFGLGLVFTTSISFSDFLKRVYDYFILIIILIIKLLKKICLKIFAGIKELILYIKEKSFKDAIQILDENDFKNLVLEKVEKNKENNIEPKINYYKVETETTIKEAENKEKENKENKEEQNENKGFGFRFFKRKKKEEEIRINKEENQKEETEKKEEGEIKSEQQEIIENEEKQNIEQDKKEIKKEDEAQSQPNIIINEESQEISPQITNSENEELDPETLKKLAIEQEKLDKEFAEQIQATEEEEEQEIPEYKFPSFELLKVGNNELPGPSDEALQRVAKKINETLEAFKIEAAVREINPGPVVTMYEVVPANGVPVQKIVQHNADLQLRLAAKSIRIIAPIPGKSAVGIEVPNEVANIVTLRDVLSAAKINRDDMSSILTFGLGKDVLGRPVNANLVKMPHLLIAGATGAGKSVCINSIIISLLMNASPEELKLILIDPKVVELSVYNRLPHLITPVVVDPKKAARAFQWAVNEMDERYIKCGEMGVRDIERYNIKVKKLLESGEYDKYKKQDRPKIMPYIVIIVDELADLMMTARECEGAIARIAQKARAVGIHMILATQRPSVNVITGLIKANFPTRIAFQVASGVDSKTILDTVGAENLLGNGDMLYLSRTAPKPVRLQGCYVSDEEINAVIDFVCNQEAAKYYKPKNPEEVFQIEEEENEDDELQFDIDEGLLKQAEELVITTQRGSIAMLQQKLKVGHKRAQAIMNALEMKGVVGPADGPKPREVLITPEVYFNSVKNN